MHAHMLLVAAVVMFTQFDQCTFIYHGMFRVNYLQPLLNMWETQEVTLSTFMLYDNVCDAQRVRLFSARC